MSVLFNSEIPGIEVRRGKVRDVYDLGDSLLIVATDRISAFDVILPTGIPDKGRVLTGLSNFWFGKFQGAVAHHLLATEVEHFPAYLWQHSAMLSGRSVMVKKAQVLPIECIVRGYVAGGGWKEYQQTGGISGVALPAGLEQCQQLAAPIFTPTTKASAGHDAPISHAQCEALVGAEIFKQVAEQSVRLYEMAARHALSCGIILADAKLEWGLFNHELILVDEIFTPDSSRFWPLDRYAPGHDQESFDKQFVRNYLETLGWNKTAPGPQLPAEVVRATRQKYVEAYERLTGQVLMAREQMG